MSAKWANPSSCLRLLLHVTLHLQHCSLTQLHRKQVYQAFKVLQHLTRYLYRHTMYANFAQVSKYQTLAGSKKARPQQAMVE
jgi:hypothetical protein